MPRFDYSRMSSAELQAVLDGIDMKPNSFCRIFGVNPKTMERWLAGKNDIPPWIFIAFALLEMQGALIVARDAAAEHIKFDNDYPDGGEYPYLDTGDDADN